MSDERDYQISYRRRVCELTRQHFGIAQGANTERVVAAVVGAGYDRGTAVQLARWFDPGTLFDACDINTDGDGYPVIPPPTGANGVWVRLGEPPPPVSPTL